MSWISGDDSPLLLVIPQANVWRFGGNSLGITFDPLKFEFEQLPLVQPFRLSLWSITNGHILRLHPRDTRRKLGKMLQI